MFGWIVAIVAAVAVYTFGEELWKSNKDKLYRCKTRSRAPFDTGEL